MNVYTNDLSASESAGAELTGDIETHFQQMSPRVQRLKYYWEDLIKTHGHLPRICDIELMDIYQIASHISLDDLATNKDDFKNRFWGGELTWRFAFEATGKPVTSFQPPCFAQKLIDAYQDVMQSRQPSWQKAMQVRGRYNSHMPVEALHLPLLGKDKSHVQHVLSIFDFASDAPSD